LGAAELLAARGVACTVAVVASVSPAPEAELRDLLAEFPHAVTVEGHYAVGGLGSLACEVAAGNGLACRIARCGVTASPAGAQGGQEFMNRLHGIAPGPVAEAAWTLLGKADGKRGKSADWAPAVGDDGARAVPAKDNPAGVGGSPQVT
jgi:transketolase